jgi:hypothetical protein
MNREQVEALTIFVTVLGVAGMVVAGSVFVKVEVYAWVMGAL